MKDGRSKKVSWFLSTVAGNFVDKIASCIIVALLIKYLPRSVAGHGAKEDRHGEKRVGAG